MADKRNKILVSFVFFLAIKYVLSIVIQLQIASIHSHNQAFMMMIIFDGECKCQPRRRTLWRYGRVKESVDQHFLGDKPTTYSPRMIKERIRLNKETYFHLFHVPCPLLKNSGTQMELGINVKIQVAITLSRLSNGNTLKMCGEMYGLTKPTTSIIVRNCCEAIKILLKPFGIPKINKITN